MNYGYFDDEAREYVITRPDTPRPWSNYLGSTAYGAIITNHAGGYSFYQSAATGRFLRLRFNSVPLDQPGRYFYLRDRASGISGRRRGSRSASRSTVTSACRHGTAYTGIDSAMKASTPSRPISCRWSRPSSTGACASPTARTAARLSVYTYCEFANLWDTCQDLINLQYSQFITRAGWSDGMLGITCTPTCRGTAGLTGCNRAWMALPGAPLAGFETVRERFLGRLRRLRHARGAGPRGGRLRFLAEGDNVCGTLQADLDLAPGETRELLVLLGLGTPASHGRATVAEFGTGERCAAELGRLRARWHAHLQSSKSRRPTRTSTTWSTSGTPTTRSSPTRGPAQRRSSTTASATASASATPCRISSASSRSSRTACARGSS